METSYESAKWSGCSAQFLWALQPEPSESEFHVGFSSSSSGNFPADCGGERADSLSRSHRMAEKRRRDRINSHLAALRKLVPNSDKLDKAALLATVIQQVKQLKQQATESPIFSDLPSESDEVTVNLSNTVPNFESDTQECKGGDRVLLFRASFCCEDRPEVLSEIIRVLKKLQLETIQANVISVGGRTRNNFVLMKKGCGSEENSAASATALKQSLGAVLSRITSSSSTTSVCRIRSKRQRWFLSSHYSQ
ncbi:PREDICTED: transcription factor bHLH51 [Tarenaya hassleriana]|uniref:transcription factor bHLH51 n=1 Tax=Tarenaya hassleriana TaxID=28532 RepID=UPI00053C2328|nr:PREDICTED: transcription factor bHLH51 [Tarenaya hassleriana]